MTYVISAINGVLESVKANPMSTSNAPKRTFCEVVLFVTNRRQTNSGMDMKKPAQESHFVP